MKLVGELKEKVEKAETAEEAKEIIEEARMELTDDELDQVAGGGRFIVSKNPEKDESTMDNPDDHMHHGIMWPGLLLSVMMIL